MENGARKVARVLPSTQDCIDVLLGLYVDVDTVNTPSTWCTPERAKEVFDAQGITFETQWDATNPHHRLGMAMEQAARAHGVMHPAERRSGEPMFLLWANGTIFTNDGVQLGNTGYALRAALEFLHSLPRAADGEKTESDWDSEGLVLFSLMRHRDPGLVQVRLWCDECMYTTDAVYKTLTVDRLDYSLDWLGGVHDFAYELAKILQHGGTCVNVLRDYPGVHGKWEKWRQMMLDVDECMQTGVVPEQMGAHMDQLDAAFAHVCPAVEENEDE